MYFKHPAARAAMFALATLLLFNTAHAESLERFKGIEAREGEYTFSFKKSDNIDGVVYTWSYQGSGSIHVSDPHKPYSCSGRPNGYVKDMEMNAYNTGWGWQRGSANEEDWACGDSQWTGGACP